MDDILQVCRTLFDSFEEEGVRYCHWKSNEHLRDGLTGATDLDILIDREQTAEVRRSLLDSGYRRFQSATFATHPAMETYLGFDHETGQLVHIHLHYRLVLGQNRVKGYRIPWEDEILDRRRIDEETKVYTADPEVEFLLLLLRYSLKIRFRDYILKMAGKQHFNTHAVDEYNWLVERADTDEVVRLAEQLLTEDTSRTVEEILGAENKNTPSIRQLRRIKKGASEVLKLHEIYSPTEAKVRGLVRDSKRVARKVNRILDYPRMSRRKAPHGGSMIVFLGADGSGKSTLTTEIEDWLSWKIDVQSVYFGSGDGHVSLLRRPMVPLRKLFSGDTADTVDGGANKERENSTR